MYLLENENDKRNEMYAGPNTTGTQAYKYACYTPTSRVFKRNMIREKHKKVVYLGIREESWNVRVLIHPQPPTEYRKTGRTFSVRGDAVSNTSHIRQYSGTCTSKVRFARVEYGLEYVGVCKSIRTTRERQRSKVVKTNH